jgi:hypothetical protein
LLFLPQVLWPIMDVQSTNQFLSHDHSIRGGLSTAVMLKPMRTVSYQAEQHANKSGAINSNSAKLTMLNAEMVLGLNFQRASKAAQLQQAKPVINLLDVERTWVTVLLNTKDGTKIMKGPFSTLHNRDAEKSNAHQPKKNLSNHFPEKINNPFTKSTRTRRLDLNVTAMSRENVSGFISMTNHMVLI